MQALLRSVWDDPRPANPPSRVWRDWVLLGALVPLTVIEGVLRPGLTWRVASVVVVAGLVPTLLWRRTRPLRMVTVAFALLAPLSLATQAVAPQLVTGAYVLLLPYALYRWGSGRELVLGSLVILVKSAATAVFGIAALSSAVAGLAVLSSMMALGAVFRFRARARQRELAQVQLLERERLARDLHDTVAHHVSAIAIRAQAGLAVAATHPEAATDALEVIAAEASRTLAEMREMLQVLRRDEPAQLSPTPQIADLAQLAGPARTGPPVEVEITGDVAGVSPSVGAAVYRLAQESVTNARRHARHATRIEVRVAADESTVHLRVRDDGDAAQARPAGSAGFGLIGMIERAHLLGGSCQAGPDPDRGWTVTAVLPRTGCAT